MQMEILGNEIADMDRFSQLPEFIIHHILSLIDHWIWNGPEDRNKQLVRMSVLSKKWYHIIACYPILDFSKDNFTKGLHLPEGIFFKFVEYATSRFCQENIVAHKFKLSTTLWDWEHAKLGIVNRCLESIFKNGVRELVIDIQNAFEAPHAPPSIIPKYRLPNTLLSVSALKCLSLYGCELPPSLLVDGVKFKSLNSLTVENSRVDDGVIELLTSSCPLLKELKIKSCDGWKRICISGHQNLQQVWIHYNDPVERIEIDAPNLWFLSLADMGHKGAPQMNLASCEKLTSVSYYGNPLPNSNGFTDFLSNFPFVENFSLDTEYKCSLKLSSHSLRALMLSSNNCGLDELELGTPNLVLFHYFNKRFGDWPRMMDIGSCTSLARQSAQMKACMQCFILDCDDTLWFQKLRLFLEKENGFKVLTLCIEAIVSPDIKEFQKLKEIELPPYELENVGLHLWRGVRSSDSDLLAFSDAVLWCCCPRSLSFLSTYTLTGLQAAAKFTYEKLLEQEDEGRTKIQILSAPASEPLKNLSDLMSSSKPFQTITFTKERKEHDNDTVKDMEIF